MIFRPRKSKEPRTGSGTCPDRSKLVPKSGLRRPRSASSATRNHEFWLFTSPKFQIDLTSSSDELRSSYLDHTRASHDIFDFFEKNPTNSPLLPLGSFEWIGDKIQFSDFSTFVRFFSIFRKFSSAPPPPRGEGRCGRFFLKNRKYHARRVCDPNMSS